MGYAFIYERLQRHRDDNDRLRIDALLDMPGARDAWQSAQDEFWGAFE